MRSRRSSMSCPMASRLTRLFREPRPPLGAVEDGDRGGGLQLLDALGNGQLGRVKFRRGPLERAELGDPVQRLQLLERDHEAVLLQGLGASNLIELSDRKEIEEIAFINLSGLTR